MKFKPEDRIQDDDRWGTVSHITYDGYVGVKWDDLRVPTAHTPSYAEANFIRLPRAEEIYDKLREEDP